MVLPAQVVVLGPRVSLVPKVNQGHQSQVLMGGQAQLAGTASLEPKERGASLGLMVLLATLQMGSGENLEKLGRREMLAWQARLAGMAFLDCQGRKVSDQCCKLNHCY